MDMTRLMFYNMIKFILIVLWVVVPDTIGGSNIINESIDSLLSNPGESSIWSSSSSPSSLSISSLSSTSSPSSSSSVISKSDQSFFIESSSSSTSSTTTPPSSNDLEETISNGVNNHPPKFNQSTYSASMLESSQQGTEVVQVYATDSDEKGTKASMIQYLLLTSDPHFSISSETGIIYLTEPLDYETTTKHHLIVAASDQGSPLLTSTCQVWVNVIDVNDNGPKFTKESYAATISEASSKDMFVTKVTAIDVDISDAVEEILKYSIVSGDPSGIFKIDPSTGIVRLGKDQSFIYDAFTLNISVTDGKHKDYASLTIKILYANKQSPIFTRPLYFASIDEKSPIGTRVSTVEAYDNDDGIYAEVTYSILSSYLLRWFTIDSKSGEIFTVSSIDRDKHSSFSLTVLAKDGGHRIALTVVKITVTGDDDAPPQFLVDKYEVAVCSNVPTVTNILPVIAYDKRSFSSSSRGSKSRIFYSISHIGLPESLSTSSSSPPISSSSSVASSTTPFRIRKKTGLIYVHGNLSNSIGSVYTFQVKAWDDNGLESVVPVTIKINGPCKLEGDLVASYEATISEMAKVNSIITSLNFTNPDNLELTLAGINSDANKFKLGEQGQIYLIEPLDRETLSRYILVVKIFDKSTYTVRYLNTFIDVLDTNDNVPTFDSDSYYIEVSEDQEVGSSIGRVHAWDGDGEDSQNAIFYKIKRGKKSAKLDEDYFDIEPETGLIKLRSHLDRELDEWHNLTVTITDGKFNNKTTLSIRVMDVNDNPPQFSSSFFNASIREGSPVGMVVTTIDASDADDSSFTSLNYFITSGDSLNQFTISNTGDLIVNKPLNRKRRDSFSLTILVSDTKYNATTTVSIDVLEAMGPICRKSEYVEIVSEDIELGTDILKVEAESKDGPVTDANVQLFYSLFLNNDKVPISSNPDENGLISPEDTSELPFALNSRTGVLTVIAPLDREKKSTYFLLAKVHDDKERENMCSSAIEIIVSDINDNEPNFTSELYRVSIPEDVQLGIVVGKVQAGDPDQGRNGEIQYSLTDSSSETFTIDSDTGLIRLNKPLDREKTSSYNLTVKAIDLGLPPLSSSVNFIVTLEDVNDNYPTFATAMYNVSVLENVTIGSEIATIEATDTDIGSNANLTYTIVDGDEDNRFIIHPKTGAIAVTKLLDREAIANYLITVKAVDAGSPPLSNKTKVNITIVDVNDNGPVCGQSKYVEMVPENTKPETFLVKIIAADPDDGPNAQLYFNVSLDSADPDSGKELANSSYLPFSVDATTGNLRVSGFLDREEKAHYLLTVVAHDNLERERTCSSTVELVISDVNDNPPMFTSVETSFIIPENSPIGTFVGKTSAIDKDIGSNGQIKFSISTLGEDNEGTFSIDEKSGTVFTAKPLDRELIDRYSVLITATDSGVPALSTSKEFTIDILDINDNAPKFTENHYSTSVYENVSVGITLIRVTATSVDTGINEDITYSIVAGNEENCFTVHPKSGSISVVKSLDREITSEYILTIKAEEDVGGSSGMMKDLPSLSSEAKVTITILDVNDNEPRFSQTSYSAVIREDTHVGEKIIQKVAIDGDIKENGQINYYFKASSLNSGTGEMSYYQTKYKEFEIEPKTGIITVASPLDREMISSYIMEVVAIDKGSPPLSSSILITIELSDVNDNPPKFDQTNYTLYIQETKKVGEVVQKFTLTDSDSHINSGPFSLDIVEGNQDGTFGIKVIGEMALILTSPLNRTRQSLYQLMICATDAGSPPLSSNSWVIISVEEEPRPTPPPPIVPTQTIQSYIPIANLNPISNQANPAPGPVPGQGPNANPPNILGNYRYRAFLWDDLILPGIFLIVMLFSCLVIGICCCCFNHHSAASKSRRRNNNRIPPSSYRPGLEGDEFLLESCNAFPSDNSGNLKRFSKMTSVESSALLGHRPFSTEPLPNHHFHQALQQAAANGGGGIGGVGIMGTPNGQIINSGCGGIGISNNNNSQSGLINNRPNSFHETMNNFDEMIRTPMSERAASGPDSRPNKRSIPKNSPTVLPTPHYPENESSHLLPTSNEGKIQNNINGTMWTNCSNGGSSAGMEGFSGESSIVSDGVDSYCSNTSINHHDGGPPDGVAIGNHAYTASHLEPNQPVINSVPVLSTTTNGIYANTGYHQYHYAPIQHTHPQNLTYRKGTSFTRVMTDNLSSQGSKSDTINQSNPSDLNTDDETLKNDHDDKRSDGLNIPIPGVDGMVSMPIDPYLTSEH